MTTEEQLRETMASPIFSIEELAINELLCLLNGDTTVEALRREISLDKKLD